MDKWSTGIPNSSMVRDAEDIGVSASEDGSAGPCDLVSRKKVAAAMRSAASRYGRSRMDQKVNRAFGGPPLVRHA